MSIEVTRVTGTGRGRERGRPVAGADHFHVTPLEAAAQREGCRSDHVGLAGRRAAGIGFDTTR